jgi:hypothetical protein
MQNTYLEFKMLQIAVGMAKGDTKRTVVQLTWFIVDQAICLLEFEWSFWDSKRSVGTMNC